MSKHNPQKWDGPRTRARLETLGYKFDGLSDEGLDWRPCKSCGQLIAWILTPKGSRMPIHDMDVPPPHAAQYDVHFATCPGADKHRRPR